MRRNLLIAALAVLVFSTVAHAQVASIYVTYAPTHLTNVQTGNPPQYSNNWTNGPRRRHRLQLPCHSPLSLLALDLRGSTRSGTPGADTAQSRPQTHRPSARHQHQALRRGRRRLPRHSYRQRRCRRHRQWNLPRPGKSSAASTTRSCTSSISASSKWAAVRPSTPAPASIPASSPSTPASSSTSNVHF